MKLKVTKEAAEWYKQELDLQDGEYIRFFVKLYGGNNTVHPNFSLGVSNERPVNMVISDEQAGITFYFNEQDEWYIKEHSLTVTLENGEIEYVFD